MEDQVVSWAKLNSCIFCNKDFPENGHFYKTHGITIKDYFHRHFPKRDLLTGAHFEFKSIEQYYLQDFNEKSSLKSYLEKLSLEDRKNYLIKLLKRRIEVKTTTKSPGQVELRSLNFPSIRYYDKTFEKTGGYYKLCNWLSLNNIHQKFDIMNAPARVDERTADFTLLIDTREQKNIKFLDRKREIGKLDFGDYQLLEKDKYGNCAIERKNLSDFVGSFGSQHERLEAEIIRAKEARADLIVLVEEDLSNCLIFNKLPKVSKYIKINPEYVFHNVRNLLQKYDNLQFLFVKNRTEAAEMVPFILTNWSWLKNYDLQLLHDSVII